MNGYPAWPQTMQAPMSTYPYGATLPVFQERDWDLWDKLQREDPEGSYRREKRRCIWVRAFKKLFGRKRSVDDEEEEEGEEELDMAYGDKPRYLSDWLPPQNPIAQQLWAQYGQWARPWIEPVAGQGLFVHNATPNLYLNPRDFDPAVVTRALLGPHGTPHPENWVPRIDHPDVPMRPPQWSTPVPNAPPPLPSQCILNPFLERRLFNDMEVHFDLRHYPTAIAYSSNTGPGMGTIPLSDAVLGQPATWPLVAHMHISGVADEPALNWPIQIPKPSGVLVIDVFNALYCSFQQWLTHEEHGKLSPQRKAMAEAHYWQRVQSRAQMQTPLSDLAQHIPTMPPGARDGLRRIDLVGDRCMFRGLSALHDGTWAVYLGPPS